MNFETFFVEFSSNACQPEVWQFASMLATASCRKPSWLEFWTGCSRQCTAFTTVWPVAHLVTCAQNQIRYSKNSWNMYTAKVAVLHWSFNLCEKFMKTGTIMFTKFYCIQMKLHVQLMPTSTVCWFFFMCLVGMYSCLCWPMRWCAS